MSSKKLFKKLVEKGLTIAFAESMTGGRVTYELIKNPGSSKVIQGSVIAYSNEQKHKLLNVSLDIIIQHTSVSREVATEMAINIKNMMNASIGVGITGNAGPSLQHDTHKKEVFVAIATNTVVETYHIDLHSYTRLKSIQKTNHFIY
ncbi:MAG: CinA family protein, partial [Acholeplasmataceae bacterium]|nr:CinA family protein [Acholeplasmataceae bacterium]